MPRYESFTPLAPYSGDVVEVEHDTGCVPLIEAAVDAKPAVTSEPVLALHLVGVFVAGPQTETVVAGVVGIKLAERVV